VGTPGFQVAHHFGEHAIKIVEQFARTEGGRWLLAKGTFDLRPKFRTELSVEIVDRRRKIEEQCRLVPALRPSYRGRLCLPDFDVRHAQLPPEGGGVFEQAPVGGGVVGKRAPVIEIWQ